MSDIEPLTGDDKTRKRKLAEMAISDSDAAPVYRLKFEREYGHAPEELIG
jgi:hypothetical protein